MSIRAFFLLVVVTALAAAGAWLYFTDRGRAPVPERIDIEAEPSDGPGILKVGEPSASPLAIGPVCPDFSLIDQAGNPLPKAHVMGRAWIVAELNANEGLADNLLVGRLQELQKRLGDSPLGRDVILFTIMGNADDGSATLVGEKAGAYSNGVERWAFVGGPADELRRFLADAGGAASGGLAMSARLTLIDPQGNWRQAYDAQSPQCVESIMTDLEQVIMERVLIVENRVEPPWVVRAVIEPPWVEGRRASQLAAKVKMEVPCDFRFEDRRIQSGIAFRHRVVDDAGRSLVTAHYDHGTGIAIGDVDQDGLYDIYFVNQVGANQLYRNLGQGKFADITQAAGVALADRISVGASFADTDNDGDADLFVTTVRGGNALFMNDGKGNFTDVTEAAGLAYVGHSSSAEFFDFDRDGLLDLFLVNVGIYTTNTLAKVVNDRFTGPDQGEYSYYVSNADAFAAHLKPDRVERSILYRNTGGNQFVDVTEAMGIVDTNWTGDASPFDANEDGWIDLYLVNMQGHDEYYQNVEGRKFERKGRELFPATPWGTMGIKAFDFDNDSHLDLFVTDMHTDMAKDLKPTEEQQKIPKDAMDPSLLATDGNHVWGNAFFRNLGDGKFEEVSEAIQAENYWPWGLSVGDLNADGFDDAFLASSMNFPFRYAINSVLLNNQGKTFVESEYILGVEPRFGGQTARPWFELDLADKDRKHPVNLLLKSQGRSLSRAVIWGALGSRSSVIFDLDNDGDVDIVTNEFNSEPQVLVSNLTDSGVNPRYVSVRLKGTKANRDGLGARVQVTAGGRTLTKVHDGQSGYLSQSACPLYFGLGSAASIDKVEVWWPSGTVHVVEPPPSVNTTVEIAEP